MFNKKYQDALDFIENHNIENVEVADRVYYNGMHYDAIKFYNFDKLQLISCFELEPIKGYFMLCFFNIPISTIIQTITDKDKLGKVSSITNMVSQGLTLAVTFLAGFVIAYFGSSILLLVCF